MSNRFHSKWHRASHHTYKNPAILDAGWDPIASNDVPFSGDFVMSPRTACLSRISGDTVVTEDIYGMEYITGEEDPGRKITIHPEIDLAGSAVSSNDLHVRGVEYIYNSVSGEETALTITGSIDINPVAGEDPEDPEVTGTAGGIYIHDGFFTMTGNSTQSGDATQTGNYALTGDFTQEGNYVITGSITADGSGAYMYISGADHDGYGLKVVNDFWVGGGSVFDGDVTISGNLKVKESTILESTLGVSGQTTLGDKTVIEKNGIEVSGNSIFKNNVNIIGDVTTDHNLYVTGSGPSAGSAYFKAISATEATIVSALINEVDISASESNGYIMKTPNPQGKKIPNPMSISPGVNNFYLSGDTLYSNSWGYFEGELKTASALYADGPVTFADTLNVGAFGLFGTYVSAAGSDDNGYGLIIEKNANIKGNTSIGGTLGVTGATTLSTLNATGAVDFDSTLNVDGATTLNSLAVTNNATVGGTLGVTGATTLNGTLKAGATTLSSVDVTGAAEIDGTLAVWSPARLHTLLVDHQATIKEDLGVNGEICVYDNNNSSVKIDKFGFNICPPSTVDYMDWYRYCFKISLGSGTNSKELKLRYDPMYGSWEFLHDSHLYIPNSGGTLARIEDINSSLTSYATKQYVDDKIGDINTILDAINGEEI